MREARGKARSVIHVQGGGIIDSEQMSGTAKVGGRHENVFGVVWGFSLEPTLWKGRGIIGGSQ